MSATRTAATITGRPLPNLIELVSNLMEHTTPPVRLTRRTLLDIYRRTTNKMAAIKNPHEFASVTVRLIKSRMAEQLVEGIRYEKTGEWYEMSQIEEEVPGWEQYMIPAKRSLYDHVIFDSEVERSFVEELEKWDIVKLYVKLPRWFTVPTPVGEYNPDWALVIDDTDEYGITNGESRIYMVSETKGTKLLEHLRPDERRKILCGEQHFEGALTGLQYKVAVTPSDLI
jgi:type III restriction enzyme